MNSLNIYEQTRIYSSLYLILLTDVIRTINTSNYYYYFEYSYIETMFEQPSNDGAKNSKHFMSRCIDASCKHLNLSKRSMNADTTLIYVARWNDRVKQMCKC